LISAGEQKAASSQVKMAKEHADKAIQHAANASKESAPTAPSKK
jgi:hypothetical protein